MISTRDLRASALTVGQRRVAPVARQWSLPWPGGGLVWTRPYAVVVEENGGSASSLRVRDRTRRIQLGVLGAGLAGALLIRWSGRRQN